MGNNPTPPEKMKDQLATRLTGDDSHGAFLIYAEFMLKFTLVLRN